MAAVRRSTIYMLAVLMVAVFSGKAVAQQRLSCNSDDMRRHYCRAYTGAGVTLLRQYSRADCKRDYSWGYSDSAIWVDHGCRAEFEVGRYPNLGNQAYNNTQTVISCASDDWHRHICPADTTGGVRLRRQVSQAGCWLDETWGFDSRGIWVDNGCRGEFEVGQSAYTVGSNNSGSSSNAGQAGNGDAKLVAGATAPAVVVAILASRRNDPPDGPIITCSSDDDLFHSCDTGPNKGVELKKRLSAKSCKLNQSWGHDDRGVWVDRGCSAQFLVRR